MELKERHFYLIKRNTSLSISSDILEIECIRVTKHHYFIKIFTPNNKNSSFYYEWVNKNEITGDIYSRKYNVLEELDMSWYIKNKLERIIDLEHKD